MNVVQQGRLTYGARLIFFWADYSSGALWGDLRDVLFSYSLLYCLIDRQPIRDEAPSCRRPTKAWQNLILARIHELIEIARFEHEFGFRTGFRLLGGMLGVSDGSLFPNQTQAQGIPYDLKKLSPSYRHSADSKIPLEALDDERAGEWKTINIVFD